MSNDDIKNYMIALDALSKEFKKSSSHERKWEFERLTRSLPCFAGDRFLLRGLKGAFGLTDEHRKKISAGIKASLATKGAA
jgi:hypothetical protein